MGAKTDFFQSQIGGAEIINYSYTDLPWKLLAKDVYYFFVYSWALPWILYPILKFGSGPLDEMYPTRQNLLCIATHCVLAVLQLGFIIALPFTIFLPVWTVVVGIAGFLTANHLIAAVFLNGKSETYTSDPEYAEESPEYAHEQWIFLNGVAVGEHWLKNNLNRLAITFKRPVLGIHNRTRGVIFDVFECLVQRNFSYATGDIRSTYRVLKKVLYDPSKSKVVFICHSQGGIEGSLVLDWLLQELPQDLLSKLEVYTFGNAANHFNNPHRHMSSQKIVQLKPLEAMSTVYEETRGLSQKANPTKDERRSNGPRVQVPPSLPYESSTSSSRNTAAVDKAIGYIEHYAHTTDFVAIWGVLHFSTNKTKGNQIPRFMGRLFARSTRRGGHQFNQHYLDGMFPLEFDAKTGKPTGAKEDNVFMEESVKQGTAGAAEDNVREAIEISYAGTRGFGTGEITTPVEVHGVFKKSLRGEDVRVKDMSRLWSYRNGGSPDEVPPLLVSEAGVVRNATM